MGNIGIMGGTFDPIHNGHLMLGRQAYEEYRLDCVWYMPSGHPPHKTGRIVTGIEFRCDMTRLAIEGYSFFAFSDFEAERGGYSYTAQTLRLLKEKYPEHSFSFIIGADSLFDIESWYRPAEIMGLATLMVADREYGDANRSMSEQISYLETKYGAHIEVLHCRELDVSSEMIRKLIFEGGEAARYVPRKVADYIAAHHLYRE